MSAMIPQNGTFQPYPGMNMGFMPGMPVPMPMGQYNGAGDTRAFTSILSQDPGYGMPGTWAGAGQYGPLVGIAANIGSNWLNGVANRHGITLGGFGSYFNPADTLNARRRQNELMSLTTRMGDHDRSQIRGTLENFMRMHKDYSEDRVQAETNHWMDRLSKGDSMSGGMLTSTLSEYLMPGGSSAAFAAQAYDAYRIGGGKRASWRGKANEDDISSLTELLGREFGKGADGKVGTGIENRGFTRGFSMGDMGGMAVALGASGRLSANKDEAKESIRSLAGVLDVVRELGGSPDAPVPVLVQKLQALTGSSLTNMDLTKLEGQMRQLKAIGAINGINSTQMGGLIEAQAVSNSRMGIGAEANMSMAKQTMLATTGYWQGRDPGAATKYTMSLEEAHTYIDQQSKYAMASDASKMTGVLLSANEADLPQELRGIVGKMKRGEDLSKDEYATLEYAVGAGRANTEQHLAKRGISYTTQHNMIASGTAADAMAAVGGKYGLGLNKQSAANQRIISMRDSKLVASDFGVGQGKMGGIAAAIERARYKAGDNEDEFRKNLRSELLGAGVSRENLDHAVSAAEQGMYASIEGGKAGFYKIGAFSSEKYERSTREAEVISENNAKAEQALVDEFGTQNMSMLQVIRNAIAGVNESGVRRAALDKQQKDLEFQLNDATPAEKEEITRKLKLLKIEREMEEEKTSGVGMLLGKSGVDADKANELARKAMGTAAVKRKEQAMLDYARATDRQGRLKAKAEHTPLTAEEQKELKEIEGSLESKRQAFGRAVIEVQQATGNYSSSINWGSRVEGESETLELIYGSMELGDKSVSNKDRDYLFDEMHSAIKDQTKGDQKEQATQLTRFQDLRNLYNDSGTTPEMKRKIVSQMRQQVVGLQAGSGTDKASQVEGKDIKHANTKTDRTEITSQSTEIKAGTVNITSEKKKDGEELKITTVSAASGKEQPIILRLELQSGQLLELAGHIKGKLDGEGKK